MEIETTFGFFAIWEDKNGKIIRNMKSIFTPEIQCMLKGFYGLYRGHIKKLTTSVTPSRVNSDIVERM